MTPTGHAPTVFVDFDDVLVLNQKFGGYDVLAPNPPPELWDNLFHGPAIGLLEQVLSEFRARVVITTSWLRFLDRRGFEQLFARTKLGFITQALHPHWEIEQPRHATRYAAITRWLSQHHRGEPFVILDDHVSGTGLAGSRAELEGRVVLCDENVGLLPEHLPLIRTALGNVPRAQGNV